MIRTPFLITVAFILASTRSTLNAHASSSNIINNENEGKIIKKTRSLREHEGKYHRYDAAIAILAPQILDDENIDKLCITLESINNIPANPHMNKNGRLISNDEILIFIFIDEYSSAPDLACVPKNVLVRFHHFTLPFNDKDSIQSQNSLISSFDKMLSEHNRRLWFWNVHIWEHEAVQPYDTIIRMDLGSCFSNSYFEKNLKDFHLQLNEPLVYQGLAAHDFFNNEESLFPSIPNDVVVTGDASDKVCEKLVQLGHLVEKYLGDHDIEPPSKACEIAKKAYEKICKSGGSIGSSNLNPKFQTHFEVMKKSFFQEPKVSEWLKTLSDVMDKPDSFMLDGSLTDGHIRFFTMAMFAEKEEIELLRSDEVEEIESDICKKRFGTNNHFDIHQKWSEIE